MYNFVDVNSTSEGFVLPSEALSINGQYIENIISGYRTLSVSGREALSPDVESFDVGNRDGSTLKGKRYPSRIIIVKYQLIAESNEAFREAYNQLGAILNVKNAELIFNDEQDKFYIGTPCTIAEVDPGQNAVVGKFEILCTDPFKYSVTEYEATTTLDDGSILIDYNGTYKSHPKLEAAFFNEDEGSGASLTGAGDCGYVAFFDPNKHIIQLGDPEEVDGVVAYAKAQTQMNQTFLSDTAWGTTAQALWAVNKGVVLPSDVQQMGAVGMGAASYAYYASVEDTSAKLVSNLLSTNGGPFVLYSVAASTTNRTANTVYVSISVTAKLYSPKDVMAQGSQLRAHINIGGKTASCIIKDGSSRWTGLTARSVTMGFTISGLSSTQIALSDVTFSVSRDDNQGTGGVLSSTSLPTIPISSYATGSVPASWFLFPNSHGTASGWHGPSITRTFGADASGEVGAKNFTLTYKQKMSIGNGSDGPNQLGGFHCHLHNASGNVVAGVRVVKNKAGIGEASLMLFVNGAKVHQVGIDLSYNNKYFGNASNSVQTSTITKVGNKLTFNIGGYSKTFTDDAITDLAVTKCTFMFERHGSSPILTYNGLYSAKFVKNNCNTIKDIPNKFSGNDVVVADCKNAEITLNGVPSPSIGALGNAWEAFCLNPGMNQIGVSYSEWVDADHAPTFKVRYREVFL